MTPKTRAQLDELALVLNLSRSSVIAFLIADQDRPAFNIEQAAVTLAQSNQADMIDHVTMDKILALHQRAKP